MQLFHGGGSHAHGAVFGGDDGRPRCRPEGLLRVMTALHTTWLWTVNTKRHSGKRLTQCPPLRVVFPTAGKAGGSPRRPSWRAPPSRAQPSACPKESGSVGFVRRA